MLHRAISRNQLGKQLRDLGVKPGRVLLGPHFLFENKTGRGRSAGINCRITVDSWSTRNFSDAKHDRGWQPSLDSKTTPCIGMGIVSDIFWRLPGVLRSDSPSAFAAIGEQAVRITAPHPVIHHMA